MKMLKLRHSRRNVLAIAVALAAPVWAQQIPASGQIQTLHVKGGIYMLVGAGGNITVQVGPDGVLLVDTGAPGMADQVLAAVRRITDQPIRYIINTSGDPEHIGGNDAIAAAGKTILGGNVVMERGGSADEGATIVANLNVQDRIASKDGDTAPYPSGAWPNDTFTSRQKNLYFNGEAIELRHIPSAHTNGDVIVFFRGSDVISAGDILNTLTYPVVDITHGGGIEGLLDGLNTLKELAVVQRMAEGGTQVIPGRGRLSDQADVVVFQEMATIVRDRVKDAIKKGMSLDQVKAAKLTEDYDPRYAGGGKSSPDAFVEGIYKSLSRPTADSNGKNR
jgi:glyoxylase-like metal-dependent hydrolase (beta-lactamase superfamily II)